MDPAVPFDPHNPSTFQPRVDPLVLKVRIVSARHLRKVSGKGLVSPFVELEVIGVSADQQRVKSRTISDNGLNPEWHEQFEFQVCASVVFYKRLCFYLLFLLFDFSQGNNVESLQWAWLEGTGSPPSRTILTFFLVVFLVVVQRCCFGNPSFQLQGMYSIHFMYNPHIIL